MKTLPLGNIIAECDHEMLDKAFYETPDYKTIIESSSRSIIIGRRGTGKSALNYKLMQFWKNIPNKYCFQITAEETQIIGIRDIIKFFGDNFSHIKAGSKLLWRYAVYIEISTWIFNHYKYKKHFKTNEFFDDIISWSKDKGSFTSKVRKKLKGIINEKDTPQTIIADLGDLLNLDSIEDNLSKLFEIYNFEINILIDKIDEGYTPDTLGIALIDGFVQTVIDINNRFNNKIRCYIFVRDNIYRAIAISDPDFTRNIESHILRIHWEETSLFNLVCNRLRISNNTSLENNRRLWNSFTSKSLQNSEGFRYCLRLTLYRPRDILVLLNNAFDQAKKESRNTIIPEDIDVSSKSISRNRLNDLHKEYESIFPSIDLFTNRFAGGSPNLTFEKIIDIIKLVTKRDDYITKKQKDISLIDSPVDIIQRLHSVGFLGIQSKGKNIFIFCHDGRTPSNELSNDDNFLIHPCYWLALNLSDKLLENYDKDEIYDEYDIEVTSVTEEQRNKKIEKLLNEIEKIPTGIHGAHDFEEWCLNTIKILFAGSLINIELHPNKNGLQQRDIVATNQSEVSFWKRVYQDYKTRQVIFEIKNIKELESDHYRQINSYLVKNYGKLGFFICRDHDNNLRSGKEISWLKELYGNEEKVVVKLTSNFLTKHLRKHRNPQKHDAINRDLSALLDAYLRKYLIVKAR